MREIKFRVWYKKYDEPNGKMFYSVMPCSPDFKEWLIAFDEAEPNSFDGDFVVGEDIEVMQFTGLKDKNGKEIYEGDIITCFAYQREINDVIDDTEKVVVGYKEGYFYPFGYNCGWRSAVYDMEIIGNIYETHSLVNEG